MSKRKYKDFLWMVRRLAFLVDKYSITGYEGRLTREANNLAWKLLDLTDEKKVRPR